MNRRDILLSLVAGTVGAILNPRRALADGHSQLAEVTSG